MNRGNDIVPNMNHYRPISVATLLLLLIVDVIVIVVVVVEATRSSLLLLISLLSINHSTPRCLQPKGFNATKVFLPLHRIERERINSIYKYICIYISVLIISIE